jgi:hypothetical protein
LNRKNGECAACLKNSVLIFVEKIYKMGCLEGSGVPVLYIGRTVPKGYWLDNNQEDGECPKYDSCGCTSLDTIRIMCDTLRLSSCVRLGRINLAT